MTATTQLTQTKDRTRYVGVACAAMLFAGYVVWSLPPHPYGSNLADWSAELRSGSRGSQLLVLSHLVLPLAAGLLLWTVAYLRRAIDRGHRQPTLGGQVAWAGALVFAIGQCLMGAATEAGARVNSGDYIDGLPADASAAIALTVLGGNIANATIWGASVLMLAIGVAAWREALLPRRLIWLGFVTAPALIAAWYYGIPMLLLSLWIALAPLLVHTESVPE